MSHYRLAGLLGPAWVLYLLAGGAASGASADALTLAMSGVALLLAATPLRVLGPDQPIGARRVALLGSLVGSGLGTVAWPAPPSVAAELTWAVVWPAAAATVIDLAVRVPRPPRALERRRWLVPTGYLLGLAIASGGFLSAVPPIPVGDGIWIAPAWLGWCPGLSLLFGLLVALLLRLLRRRLGSDTHSLAASAWAALGCVAALPLLTVAATLFAYGTTPGDSTWSRGSIVLGGGALVLGHTWLLDQRRLGSVGATGRRLGAGLLTLLSALGAQWWLQTRLPEDGFARLMTVGLALVLLVFLHRVYAVAMLWAFVPRRGVLLRAASLGREDVATGGPFDLRVARCLKRLRDASGVADARPVLYGLFPERALQVDSAGQPVEKRESLPIELKSWFESHGHQVLVTGELGRLVVRRPELRPLVAALERIDALCVLPLVSEGELEGALLVPRGRRGTSPDLEELAALELLCQALTGPLLSSSAELRAHLRAEEGWYSLRACEERAEALELELSELRAHTVALSAGVLGAGRALVKPVAYSPGMRALLAGVCGAADQRSPVMLVAGAGTPLESLVRLGHLEGGRSGGPLLLIDCASLPRDDMAAILFGRSGAGPEGVGLLELAEGGTLFLRDLPAIPVDLQARLSEVIATHRSREEGARGQRDVDVRMVFSARLPVSDLLREGTLDAELSRQTEALTFKVPPLRERTQDLESLVMLALDRASRLLGRGAPGVHPDVLEVLTRHDWPGDVDELAAVIESAVLRTRGTQVQIEALPEGLLRQYGLLARGPHGEVN